MVVLHDSVAGVGGVANFDVDPIPAGYKMLIGVLSGRGETAATQVAVGMRFNNDSGANYDQQVISGIAAAASAAEGIGQTSAQVAVIPAASATAGVAAGAVFHLHDYDGTVFHKWFTSEGGSKIANSTGSVSARKFAGYWRNTAAITRITLVPAAGDFAEGTRFTLYGVA